MSIQVTGLNELVSELRDEAVETPLRARHVIQIYAARVQATAKQFVPRNTGDLARSITRTTRLLREGAEGEVGPTVRYGMFVEYGTSKMAPRAYLGPALDRHSSDYEAELARIPFGWNL